MACYVHILSNNIATASNLLLLSITPDIFFELLLPRQIFCAVARVNPIVRRYQANHNYF
ncbi:hypothetical protein DSUL_50100 [Desulfovibrionales bacterium]